MMSGTSFSIGDLFLPHTFALERDYFIAYKPPGMHTARLDNSPDNTLFDWACGQFPEIAELPGRKEGEGGLLHRLDYETQGLVLFARTRTGMESLLEQQKKGKLFKEYSALTAKYEKALPGFPAEKPESPIKSAFRPYGPGRKAVRPVVHEGQEVGRQYTTKILETRSLALGITVFRLGISTGFRHQIRSHLAWLRLPILNDRLYGGCPYGKGFLGLRAISLSFIDPGTGKEQTYSILPLDPGDV